MMPTSRTEPLVIALFSSYCKALSCLVTPSTSFGAPFCKSPFIKARNASISWLAWAMAFSAGAFSFCTVSVTVLCNDFTACETVFFRASDLATVGTLITASSNHNASVPGNSSAWIESNCNPFSCTEVGLSAFMSAAAILTVLPDAFFNKKVVSGLALAISSTFFVTISKLSVSAAPGLTASSRETILLS